ncbi:retrovirus-related pol polyprotein from transposon TNT 1-94 [Tanacetum coccineum]
MVKNKGLVAKAYEWDKEDVSSDENDMTEVKVLMALADDENVVVGKESAINGEWVKISMKKVHTLLDMEDNDERKSFLDYLCIDLNYVEEQRNNIVLKHRDLVQELNTCKEQLLVLKQAKLDFLTMQHLLRISANESSVCSTPLPSLEKLASAEPISKPKTIKSILKSNSTFKPETLKGVTINEPSSAPAKDNKNVSASKRNSAPTSKLKNVKIIDDIPLVISLRRGFKPRNPQKVTTSYETCGSTVHTTTDHSDIEWFRRGEALQAKKAKAFQSKKTESSNANRSKTPTKSGCSRHMSDVKSYLHKYVEQPGPKVVFGDDSTCITEGYGSIICNGIVFIKVAFVNGLKYNLVSISQLCDAKYIIQFDEKRGTIFNSNKETVMIAPKVRDVYVLDMTSSAQESCFFAKATKNLNCLWHKRLVHLNFKTINQLAKQNLVIGLPSLVYSKDKPCSSCEKGKHHKASFKTKQTFSIKKSLHLLHMDLFGPVTPRFINHEKYTLVIIDEYSRSTIVKRHLKTPYEIFRGRLQNIAFLHVLGCLVFIHNHKDHLGKFDEKLMMVISLDTHLFLKPSGSLVQEDNKLKKHTTSHLMKALMYQVNSNDISFIEPYEEPEPVVLETNVSLDPNDQTDKILNDDQPEHSNHNNDEPIIENLLNTKDVQTSEPLSSPA